MNYSKTLIRFGKKDQILSQWYILCKQAKLENINKIIALAVEYNELTGRYIEIARIRLPEHQNDVFTLCVYLRDGTFFSQWYEKNHIGFNRKVREILNHSITVLSEDSCDEFLISYYKLEDIVNKVRYNTNRYSNNIDTVDNALLRLNNSIIKPINPVSTEIDLLKTDRSVEVNEDVSKDVVPDFVGLEETKKEVEEDAKKEAEEDVDIDEEAFFAPFLDAVRA